MTVGQGSDCLFTYANSMMLPSMELLRFHILKLSDTDICIYLKVLDIDLFFIWNAILEWILLKCHCEHCHQVD